MYLQEGSELPLQQVLEFRLGQRVLVALFPRVIVKDFDDGIHCPFQLRQHLAFDCGVAAETGRKEGVGWQSKCWQITASDHIHIHTQSNQQPSQEHIPNHLIFLLSSGTVTCITQNALSLKNLKVKDLIILHLDE